MGFASGVKQIFHTGGWPVLLVLIALSIYSIALIWERWVQFKRFSEQLEEAEKKIRHAVKEGQFDQAIEAMRGHRNPIYWILTRTAGARGTREERRGVAALAIERQLSLLQAGLSSLGTIGSIAPFVGLFGTILGVMRAFKDLAAYSGAGANTVAAGIAEALIATATGLFVAIPAIVAYNYFSRRAQQLAEELSWLSEELLERYPVP